MISLILEASQTTSGRATHTRKDTQTKQRKKAMGNCCASKQPQKKPSRGGGGAGGDKVAIGENGRKIVLLGEMSTGKTCLVLRLVKNEFSEKELPTIGFAAHKHKQCHQVHFFYFW